MENLVIGNTSQLSYYFPNDYIKVSSRNINYDLLINKKWDRVFICIGESRKFINNQELYDKINVDLTLDLIEKFRKISQKIIIYSTCELWNKYDGQINLNMDYNFYKSFYITSKDKINRIIMSDKEKYNNVVVLYPFNFNSIFRTEDFLFGKIFNSILNKTKIEIGDTYFYRDLVHPKYVVERSINANSHEIVGSGRLTFVNDFIRDLYKHYGLIYENFVIENKINFKQYEKRKEYYLETKICQYTYSELLTDTINDINKKLKNNEYAGPNN
jgi:nucleoside-diphosphate-sugar epimerase